MTENKRFVNIGNEIHLNGEWWCSANGEHCADVITTALNELNDENEQLKNMVRHNYVEHKRCVNNYVDKIKEVEKENEQLKSELKIYRNVANCGNCKYHDYDWDINDGYGGDEYEVCDKGNDVTEGICEDWEEL